MLHSSCPRKNEETIFLSTEEKPLPKVAQKAETLTKKPIFDRKKEKKPIDKEEKPPYSVLVDTVKQGLSEDEQHVVSLLESGERLVDDVIAETGLTTGKILALLTMLELKGVVKRLPGKRICLK